MKKSSCNSGAVSLETIVIVSILIVVGSFFVFNMYQKGIALQEMSHEKIDSIDLTDSE